MNRYSAIALRFAVLGIVSATVVAQEATPAREMGDLNLRVEITTDKTDYTTAETISFRALLINGGQKSVYIAKSWGPVGGGIAGFNTQVKQLSGTRPKSGCSVAGDRGFYNESRSPQQILREDFLLLSPGELVGFNGSLPSCSGMPPARFKLRRNIQRPIGTPPRWSCSAVMR